MKITRTLILGIATVLFCSIWNKANAQLNIGIGSSYGSDIEVGSLNLRAGYLIGDKFNVRADGNIFRSRTAGATRERWQDLNFNGSYWVRPGEHFILYPLAGLNITTINSETTFAEPDGATRTITDTNTETGLNLGGGIGYEFRGFTPFLEGKYVTGDLSQAVYTIGLLYVFGR